MARKNRGNSKKNQIIKEEAEKLRLHPETKKSIWAVVFLSIAAILILASFQNAGPFGNFLHRTFNNLFGWGYYFLPLIFLIMAGVFLISEKSRIHKITFLGAIIFVLAGLGLIDIIFPEKGGLVGRIAGFLEIPFGHPASLVIIIALIFISFLIILDFPIKIKKIRKNEEFKQFKINESIIAPSPLINEAPNKKPEQKEEEIEEIDKENSVKITESPKLKKTVLSKVFKDYIAPPLSLLKSSIEKPTVGDLRANANIIKRTLENFGIPVEMGEINIGPKVTRYTLKPAEGVKISRITALNQDLALALASHPIRIEAPIPGKSLVGIEVPNKASALVRLGSLMAYSEFNESGIISFALGRDVNGQPIFPDISKMPHLLVAGTTGSGKSIAIHSILISLLYKNSPRTLRLILVDPKRIELSIYNDLPHLISPVITEAKKSVSVFRWAILEMERRYELLLQAGSRDIQNYNKKNSNEPLPYILIVVDELADLMFAYGREIEGFIVRLAQMARATGLHLVLSTQRPSVEVVTGLIKANIASRIALQLPSQVDSRTVLDTAGAEKLLGGGDMLFLSSESSKPKRIQGSYIPEEETRKVTDFIRENNKDFWEKDETVLFENGNFPSGMISEDTFESYSNNEDDELFNEAVKVIIESKKASASLLQRRLKIGYARAARLLDIMEIKGIIGPGDGAKPREVYFNKIDEL